MDIVSNITDFLVRYGALIGTIIASLTALVIAIWGRGLKRLGYKPKIEIVDLIQNNQNPSLDLWRLVIKNSGNDTAKKVQVDIVEVFDDGNKVRKNFLPIPLRWTHLDTESREILPNQTVYLDLFEHINRGKDITNLQFFLRFGSRYAQEIKDFCFLEEGDSKINLKIFQESGDSLEITIYAKWDGQHIFDSRVKGRKWFWEKAEKKN
ncbi:MAG: hypothetical protein HYW63_05110 [Candidatus Levybacteria bacterium]|nr:hypothetical protein [Candidatus Levybacteria bacterium]